MKSRYLVLIVIGIFILVIGGCGCSNYNSLVNSDQNVKKTWSYVQGQYQRRMDVFKNIEGTIKASAKFEDTVLTKVTKARYEAEQIRLDPNNPQSVSDLAKAQTNIANQIRVIFENYPQLQTTQSFKEFKDQIEGTENRIATARRDYTDAINEYNVKVKRFPMNIFAGMFGYKEISYYQAETGAEKAPDVFK